MYKNHKVIATTFAGRQDRMSILVGYMIKALEKNIIDEYHVWDFTRNANDKEWLKSLPLLNDKIKLFTDHFYEGGKRMDNQWKPYYTHYVKENYSEETVIIKMDDDIVYVDLEGMSEFIKFRVDNPNYFLVCGNVVNNGVSTALQQRYGAIPKDICPPDGFPYDSECGRLWESGDLAFKLHNYFIENKEKFKKDGFYEPPIGERISINFISFLGKDFDLTKDAYRDDEKELSREVGARRGRGNVVFFPMLAAHLSFFPQERTMNSSLLIEKYKDLADKS